MTSVCTKCGWSGEGAPVPHLKGGGGLCHYQPIPLPEVDFPGLEVKLSPDDQAALDALTCPKCNLPGLRDGICIFGSLHRTQERTQP